MPLHLGEASVGEISGLAGVPVQRSGSLADPVPSR